eukprot:TRINITY_DN21789_c0_g1_i1.p1 TRINITY_DN21789_c0_g1~~TRINITY_DN21789_c0_g1_i1.p1  ORF type:complete len:1273 (+),score=262.68 TRINITY_DN21789_c0_g1_i1:219-4037(+)
MGIDPLRTDLHPLAVGDVIIAVDGKKIKTLDEYKATARGEKEFTITIQRTTGTRTAEEAPKPSSPSSARLQHAGFAATYVKHGPGACPKTCVSLWLIVVVLIVSIGLAVLPVDVETSFDSFTRADVTSSTQRDAFLYALKFRQEQSRRLQMGSAALFTVQDFFLAYELKDSSKTSIFHPETLETIAKIEKDLRALEGWKKMCEGAESYDFTLCDHGVSYANFAKPSAALRPGSIVPKNVTFDGHGDMWLPNEPSMGWVNKLDLGGLLFPKGFQADDIPVTTSMRSAFRFRKVCCSAMDPMSVQSEVVSKRKEEWSAFVTDWLLPFLQEQAKSTSNVKVYYNGDGFEGVEVMQALRKDATLSTLSFCFVLMYLMVHTRSVLLSIMGLLIIGISVPLSYVIFAVLSGATTMSIASFLSLFLVVGLGSDVVFVYTDVWRDSVGVADNEEARMVWCYQHAGKATLATTFTTALSFFANLASVLKPLREFGLFMGLCVVLVWLLVSGVFLPLCKIDDDICRSRLGGCCKGRSPGMMSGKERRGGVTGRAWLLGRWSDVVFMWKYTVLVVSGLAVLICIIGSALSVKSDTGVPSLFPADHNQNRGKEIMSRFADPTEVFDLLAPAPSAQTSVCSTMHFTDVSSYQCPVIWCEADWRMPMLYEDTCQCYRKESFEMCQANPDAPATGDKVSQGVHRVVSQKPLSATQAVDLFGDRFVKPPRMWIREDAMNFVSSKSAINMERVSSAFIQEWDFGTNQNGHLAEMWTNVYSTYLIPCYWEEVCFCGTYTCSLPEGWKMFGDAYNVTFPEASASASADPFGGQLTRRLQIPKAQWKFDPSVRATVDVVFGLSVLSKNPMVGEQDMDKAWSFSDAFDLRQPWAQRNIYIFCRDIPEELRITQKWCWLSNFRDHLVRRDERFPVLVEEFSSKALNFLYNEIIGTPAVSAMDYAWVRGDEIKAVYLMFHVDVHKHSSIDVALAYKAKWSKYLGEYNTGASSHSAGAWHTAQLWVRAEAQQALESSTLMTLAIVLVLAFLGMIVFTRDAALSFFVVLATVGVVCGLAFFITTVMQWAVGPIEVISLIVFIGYAVTYALHVAHKYGSLPTDPEGEPLSPAAQALRGGEGGLPDPSPSSSGSSLAGSTIQEKRARFALMSIGPAAVGSAITTAGCAVFLLFCTMTIFQKLGAVVLAVTVMSILTAVCTLPAALMVCGPSRPGRCFGNQAMRHVRNQLPLERSAGLAATMVGAPLAQLGRRGRQATQADAEATAGQAERMQQRRSAPI